MKEAVMHSAKSQGLPWVEKYRPDKLDELIAHEDIIRTITCFMKEDRLPHLLFYGPPGTGKTSTILACAKQMYGHKQFPAMVLELNASDDRGIGVVREQIYSFASTRSMFNSGFKLVILDEADAMTQDAQNALRRVIEKFTKNTRFCLICNYLTKIIPAIQSRCTRFRFGPLSNKQIIPRLQYVIKEEKLNVTPDGEKALTDLAQGDMRKVLNVLQCAALAFEEVNEVNVYTCVGHPLKSDIKCIVNWLLNDDFVTASKNIRNMQASKGLALQDIITQVHLYVHRIDLPANVKIHLLVKMSDIEDHLAYGTNEKIQLSALISAFQVARDMVP